MKHKRAFVLLLCGLVLLSVPGYADYTISVDRDTIDFGTATEGYAQDTYKQTLNVTNTGTATMPDYSSFLLNGQTTAFVIETGAVYLNIPAGESRAVILKPAGNLTPGTYTAVLEAKGHNSIQDEVKEYVQLTFTVIAAVAPTFTSATSATFTQGTGGSHTFTASGTTPIAFTIAEALPTGVTLNNGVLTVDDTAAAGGYTLSVTAANGAGSVTQTFTLTISAAPVAPTFTSAASATFTQGTGGSHTFTATGDAPITFAVTSALPTEVTLNNGVLTVDNTAAAGSHTLTVTAINGAGSVTQRFTLTVKAKSSGGGSSDDWEPVEDIRGYEQAIVIKCREWANVRSGPSTDTEIVGRVYLGESISLLQWNKDETWCKILYDGDSKMGWLYYKFIKPVK